MQVLTLWLSAMAMILNPLASAQSGAPTLTITQVQSDQFPTVTAFFTAADSAGRPIANLTVSEVQLFEDGSPVSPADYQVEAVESDPVSIVLALDTSVEPSDFSAVQAATERILDSLGSQDQVALIAFAEAAEIVQDFTADKGSLRSAIQTLGPTGNSTALNDAALRAANLATTAPTARRVVIVVTNSDNNSGGDSPQPAIDTAAIARIPIHTIGYTENATAESLSALSATTGGQSFTVADAGTVETPLTQLVTESVIVSYRLTLYSAIRPDNQPHTLTISLIWDGVVVEAESSFVAVGHEIGVSVPGLIDGQVVVGKVYLVAEVESAAGVVAVDYFLNGQPIASATTAPYSFEWDSTTVNPGPYQLTVRATDGAGNQGETTLLVTVSLPFTVQISAESDRAQIGDDIIINARIGTPAQIMQVDLLIDGQVIDTRAAPNTAQGYRFTFNTKPFTVGEHTISVRATDTQGRSAESTLPMRFTAAWLPIVIRWAFAVLIAVAIVVTLLVGLGTARSLAQSQTKNLFKVCYVQLNNEGNARTRYELCADDPGDGLSFEFSLNGTLLTQRQVTEPIPGAQSPASVVKPVSASQPAPMGVSGPGGGGATNQAKQALGFSATIGSFISSIGYLLPGGLGAGMMSFGTSLQTGQAAVSRVERQADLAKHAVGSKPSFGSTPPISTSRPSPNQPATQPASAISAAAPGRAQVWWQTLPVEPGQSLSVSLALRPLKSKSTARHNFRVQARAIDAEGAPPMMEQGIAEVRGLSLGQRLMPLIALLGTLMVVLVLIALLAVNIGLFGQ